MNILESAPRQFGSLSGKSCPISGRLRAPSIESTMLKSEIDYTVSLVQDAKSFASRAIVCDVLSIKDVIGGIKIPMVHSITVAMGISTNMKWDINSSCI